MNTISPLTPTTLATNTVTFTQAVLAYEVIPPPNIDPAFAALKVGAVQLVMGEQSLIGFSVATDATVVVPAEGSTPTKVRRTLTLALTATFNENIAGGFPAGDQVDPASFFYDLYTQTLARALSAEVTALPPVVT